MIETMGKIFEMRTFMGKEICRTTLGQAFSSPGVQFSCSVAHVRLLATPWTAAHQASLSTTNSRS